jgi:hypothetical protein
MAAGPDACLPYELTSLMTWAPMIDVITPAIIKHQAQNPKKL